MEDFISDITSNFDKIYSVSKNSNFILLKTGDKTNNIINGMAPVYFELGFDGKNYYLVVSAIPKGDKNLQRSIKKETLIYSRPSLGSATVSDNSAVSVLDGEQVGAANAGSTSDKSNVSIESNISQAKSQVNKNFNRNIKEALNNDQLNETTKKALAGNKKSLDVLKQIKPEIRQALIEKNSEKIVKNDKPKNEAGNAELAVGYSTESGRSLQEASEKEFVIKPDGSKDFGEITADMESTSNGAIKAGKVCLQVGHGGYGLIHIKKTRERLEKSGIQQCRILYKRYRL